MGWRFDKVEAAGGGAVGEAEGAGTGGGGGAGPTGGGGAEGGSRPAFFWGIRRSELVEGEEEGEDDEEDEAEGAGYSGEDDEDDEDDEDLETGSGSGEDAHVQVRDIAFELD